METISKFFLIYLPSNSSADFEKIGVRSKVTPLKLIRMVQSVLRTFWYYNH